MMILLFGLSPLPCDCIVDPSLVEAVEGYLECPWCGDTFSVPDFYEWFTNHESSNYVQRPPRRLIKHGHDLLEVMGQCQCMAPIVRVREKALSKAFHLDAGPDECELLSN